MKYFNRDETICAVATGSSMSAIAVIRVSGQKQLKLLIQFLVKTF